MKSAKLKDLYHIDTSSHIRAKDALLHGAYPYYTSGKNIKSLNTYQYNTRGLVIGKGGNPNWHYVEGKFSISSDCCLLTNKQEIVDVQYAYYYFCAHPSMLYRLYKGAGIKHISISDIQEIQIDYPDLVTQRTITTAMAFLDDIIKRRKNTKEDITQVLLNYYLSIVNEANGLEEVMVHDVVVDIKSGPFESQLLKRQIKRNGEIYVLGIENIKNGVVKKQTPNFLPVYELEKYKRYLVKERDVLVSIMGTLGYSAVVPENFGLAINTKHLADITVDSYKCNSYFLSYAFANDPFIKSQYRNCKRGAIMDGISLADLKGMRIKLPNLKAQNRFEQIFSLCRKIGEEIEMETSLLEELRCSLLKKLFSEIDKPTSKSQDNLKTELDIEAIIQLIEQGTFVDIANYDEIRRVLYECLDKKIVSQVYDEESQTIKLKVNETYKT